MEVPVLNITQFQKSKPLRDFYINVFSEHILLNKDLIAKPHKHDFYLCVLFTKGSGTHEIDFNAYPILPGSVFFLRPGQTHYWKFDSAPEGYIFFHSQEFYEMKFLDHKLSTFPFYYTFQNPPFLKLNNEDIANIKKKLAEVFSEYKQHTSFRDLKIVSLITEIYIDFTREYAASVAIQNRFSSRYLNILENFEHLIDQNFRREKFPKFYAEQLHITTKHLNRVLRETIDKTTSEMISERIILEAKRLIVNSDDSFSVISDTLEFTDYSYFSKIFKSKTGMTPLQFRKQYINH
ncbi:AraC family transcriptional regulator [Flavimarina sp. Hel_I_48]|uniref:AraC family transcriptional regulator n=1 Tax=Flavimarina sp. Hel_I_48 TaxID=1392488 RepID=UPI0004DF8EA0|nr:helix-turn-helix transcriptional regulator [Flavimarina sp. Hel_I_48]